MKGGKKQHGFLCAVFLMLLAFFLYWLFLGRAQFCLFRMYTGLPCPGCGLTHAALALVHGKFRESFICHPLLLPVLFVFLTVGLRKITPFRILYGSKVFYLIFFGMMVLLYVVRMILYFPDGPYPMVYDSTSLAGRLLSYWMQHPPQ